jgi:hypothetical protein
MDPQGPPSRRRLPGPGHLARQEARAKSRDRGIRLVRRLSNWTAVALVAATAATAGYFARAHPATQQPAPATGSRYAASPASSAAPCVTVPVAVSGGSGVTPATVPAQSCAPGPGGGTRPAVVYVQQGEDRGD